MDNTNYNSESQVDFEVEPDIEIQAYSTSQLALDKIEARLRLLAMPPEEAQKLVDMTLYPQYWEFNIADYEWEESIPTIEEIITPITPLRLTTKIPMNDKLTPEDLQTLFGKLQAAGLDAVVVGGQAVNLWASKFSELCPTLKEFMPFASEDLDFYGGRIEAVACHKALGGKLILNKDFDPSPNSGIVVTNYFDRPLRIDFLASVFGLNDADIESTALPFSGRIDDRAENKLKVLHPVLCLEGKLKCLKGLPQRGRQDLKHVKMSILCVEKFLEQLCQNNDDARPVLPLVERVLKTANREDALSAWYHHGVEVELGIPINTLNQLNNEKWKKFCEIRFPQAIEQIRAKRERYLELRNITASRTE